MSSYGIFILLGLPDVAIPAIFECMAHSVVYFSAADVADLHDKT